MARRYLVLYITALSCLASAQTDLKSHHWKSNYDLQDVTWKVRITENQSIRGDVVDTLVLKEPARTVQFDCAQLKVEHVRLGNQECKFKNENDRLIVTLPHEAGTGKKLSVEVVYSGSPTAGLYFVPAGHAFPAHTPIVYTQGEMEDNHYWLPTYDYPDDKATSHGTIIVPGGWKVLSNGRLVGMGPADEHGNLMFKWSMDVPHSTYLISLVAGPYSEITDSQTPVPTSYWVPVGLEDQGKEAFGGTAKIIELYGKLTGVPYPYPKFAQSAVADFMFGGMENISAVTQTINTLHPSRVEPLADSNGLVAHELAHQWFGDLVTAATWSHIWLNEGFATFLPPFWDRERKGQEAFDIDRFNILRDGYFSSLNKSRPMIWGGYTVPMDMFDGFAYPGGAARMFMLMHQVGEKPFWAAIKTYLNEYKYKNATTEQFFASMSKSLDIDLDNFRKQWFYTPGAPVLTVKRDGDGISISQGQPAFDVKTEALVIAADGTTQRIPIVLSSTAGPTKLAIAGHKIQRVIVDPDVWIMGAVVYEMGYSAEDWRALYDHAPNAAQKERLMDIGLGALSVEQRVALARSEKSDRLLADLIGRVDSADYALEMTQNPDKGIENAAVNSLGSLPKSDAVIARLREIADGEPNDILRLSAIRSLVNLTGEEAIVEKAWTTDGFQDSFREFALNWWADHDADKAREVALEVMKSPPSEPVRQTAMRVLGRVKDKPGEKRAYSALLRVLDERSVSGVRTAIGALGQYGDPAAIPHIEPFLHHGLHFTRRDAENALSQLRGR